MMKPREAIEHRKAILRPSAVEMAAVNLAAEKLRDVWNTEKGTYNDRHFHPKNVQTADDVINTLDCDWKRRVKLLDLALMIGAHRAGRELASNQTNMLSGDEKKVRGAIYQKRWRLRRAS